MMFWFPCMSISCVICAFVKGIWNKQFWSWLVQNKFTVLWWARRGVGGGGEVLRESLQRLGQNVHPFTLLLLLVCPSLSLPIHHCIMHRSATRPNLFLASKGSLFQNLFEPPRDKTNKMTVRPAKTQISQGIRQVWSESLLCVYWAAKDPSFLHADSEDSEQTARMPRLIWVFAGRTCHFVGFVTRRLIYCHKVTHLCTPG